MTRASNLADPTYHRELRDALLAHQKVRGS